MAAPLAPVVRRSTGDRDVDLALEEHKKGIDDVQRDPILKRRTIKVTLPDAALVQVRHGLGRTFENFVLSPPTGATTSGRIVETAGAAATEVKLTATGYGATITVRLTIW